MGKSKRPLMDRISIKFKVVVTAGREGRECHRERGGIGKMIWCFF